MPFHVELTEEAESEAEEAHLWLRERSPASADKWFNGLQEAIESLARQPERCALAPESDAFEEPIRQLFYGRRHGTYRILFTIGDRKVLVLHIRHGSRARIEP